MLCSTLTAKSSGFSLLELTIALFVFSSVLLIITRLQLTAWRYEQTAYERSVAMVRAMSLAENLQACGSTSNSTACWNNAVSVWRDENTNYLPNVKTEVQSFPFYYRINLSSQSPLFAWHIMTVASL